MKKLVSKKKLKYKKIHCVLVTWFCSKCNGEYVNIYNSFKDMKKDIKEDDCYCNNYR